MISGVTCMICKSVTNGKPIEFPNIEIFNQINCCRDAVISCTLCSAVILISLCVANFTFTVLVLIYFVIVLIGSQTN